MLAIVAAALFVVGAFAANGHELFGWSYAVWLLAGLAAWVLHGAYPVPLPTRRRRP
jgi:ABC-type polysaccharide/polyol phosphate export permease